MGRKPTATTYANLDEAYDYFNAELFGGTLPAVLITWQRKNGALGYFSPDRFSGLYDRDKTHEIALNPAHFESRTQLDILSTLGHEMCHVWQQAHGRPPRRGYHDRQWAAKMESIGLIPSSTGKPGGKPIGQRMTHYLERGGPFEKAALKLLAAGPRILYHDTTDTEQKKKKAASKTKYTCPTCATNAWAKPDTNLVCGDCEEPMKPEIREDDDDEN